MDLGAGLEALGSVLACRPARPGSCHGQGATAE
jgi:hypothetical protein